MTINEMMVDSLKNVKIGTELTRKEIIAIVQEKYPLKDTVILPSDLCYNSSNKGIEVPNHLLYNKRLFLKVKRGVYKYVGPDFEPSEDINPNEFGTR